MTSISLEDTLEWAKKQLRVAHNNYDRVKDRHYDPEQLNDLRKKIGHWTLIVSKLEPKTSGV